MTGLAAFRGPILKMQRADRHIQELEATISAFISSRPAYLVRRPHTEARQLSVPSDHHLWVVRFRTPPPNDLGSIVGDAIHNMRSALDLLACGIVSLNGGSTSNVHFPFGRDSAALEKQINEKKFHRAHPRMIEKVRNIRPYFGGNSVLRGLHDLDIIDKHRTIVPALCMVRTPQFNPNPTAEYNASASFSSVAIEDGQEFWSVPIVPGLDAGREDDIEQLRFILPDDVPFSFDEVIETTHRIRNEVRTVIRDFHNLSMSEHNVSQIHWEEFGWGSRYNMRS